MTKASASRADMKKYSRGMVLPMSRIYRPPGSKFVAGQPGLVGESFAPAETMVDFPGNRFVGVDGAFLAHGSTSGEKKNYSYN